MANEISKITLPGGQSYDLKDTGARELISELESYSSYLGVTTTELTDGSSVTSVDIDGSPTTAVKGNIVNYGSKEFIFNGKTWQEFGDLSGLKALAYKENAQGSYKPAGTVSKPTAEASTTKATVNSITDVGALPTFTVAGETLTINAGTLPTKGSDTSVVTDVTSVTVTQPTFTGTDATITVS